MYVSVLVYRVPIIKAASCDICLCSVGVHVTKTASCDMCMCVCSSGVHMVPKQCPVFSWCTRDQLLRQRPVTCVCVCVHLVYTGLIIKAASCDMCMCVCSVGVHGTDY